MKYEELSIEIISFTSEDIITESETCYTQGPIICFAEDDD